MGSDEATGLHEKATESGAGGGLEALLQDNGGVMTGVSVVDLEAEVMRDVYVVGTASVGELSTSEKRVSVFCLLFSPRVKIGIPFETAKACLFFVSQLGQITI